MIEIYIYIFSSVIIVSLISLIGIAAMSISEVSYKKVIFILVSIATGALFGDSMIHLIPEVFENTKNTLIPSFFVLLGIVVFFAFEKFLRWQHTHETEDDCDENIHKETSRGTNVKIDPLGHMIVLSDGIHNFIDGIIIGVSYLISIELGIATTIAIMLHEIPQELGEFAILLHSGFSKMRAVMINLGTSLISILGAAMAILIFFNNQDWIPAILAFAAGNFIYIAGSDLIPEIHKTSNPRRSFLQFISVVSGIAIMFLLVFLEI